MQTKVRTRALARALIPTLALVAVLQSSCAKHKEPQPSNALLDASANFIETQEQTLNARVSEENKETPAEREKELTARDNGAQ